MALTISIGIKPKGPSRQLIGYLYFKMFRYSVKSIKEQEDSEVIVVVLLLTKPTLSGLSVGTSNHPDCWTDTMTEVLSFSLSQFPGLTPRLDGLSDFGPS